MGEKEEEEEEGWWKKINNKGKNRMPINVLVRVVRVETRVQFGSAL
jgi:hypothetical protein